MTPAARPGRRRRADLRVIIVGRPRSRAAAGLGEWLARAAPASARGEVVVALVSDAHMRRLNRRFRGKAAPTDVLSFPADAAFAAPEREGVLGELAIAVGVARAQARAYGHPLAVELRVLALHGLLHLLGYDHERDRGTMRRLEERLRRRAGLPAGLIGRTPRPPR
ncbi:MAG: rRNA maturation RNase YbeY [Acidobacteria bacterium]|nr:rRNA maturation RNase YbeY [Acidobacteriota bacterium]